MAIDVIRFLINARRKIAPILSACLAPDVVSINGYRYILRSGSREGWTTARDRSSLSADVEATSIRNGAVNGDGAVDGIGIQSDR
jgi:hypothetical protein